MQQTLVREPIAVPLPERASDVEGHGAARTEKAALQPEHLSCREAQVLALVAEGNGNKEIGTALHISERTVKNHMTSIMTKLRASDRTHAVVTAVRLGWLAL